MLNEGGVSAYNPVSLDGNMPPSLPPQDPSREHSITDSVSVTLHPADAPNALRHPVSAPRPDARADAPADPAPPDASDTPASPVPPPPPPAGYAPGVLAHPISAVVKRFVVPHRSRPVRLVMPRLRRTPYRRTRLLSNRVLRAWFKITSRLPRCFVIVIMTSVFEAFQRRQKNADLYCRYSATTTTRQYFELGGSAADWRYVLKHKYVTFTDPDLHRRAGELLSLRVLSEGALLLSVFSAGASSTLRYAGLRGSGGEGGHHF